MKDMPQPSRIMPTTADSGTTGAAPLNDYRVKPEGNYMIVQETGDADNDPLGGYSYHYKILEHKIIDEEICTLEYETRAFPFYCGNVEPSKEHRASIPRAGRITHRDARTFDILLDEEIEQLRDNGVTFYYHPKDQKWNL